MRDMRDWIPVRVTNDPQLREEIRMRPGLAFRQLAQATTVQVFCPVQRVPGESPRASARLAGMEVMIDMRYLDPTPEQAARLGLSPRGATTPRSALSPQPLGA